jgi:hypothetical protein
VNCSTCKQPTKHVFEMMEEVAGVGPERRFLCFRCVGALGEREMALSRKALCPTCDKESVTVVVNRENAIAFSCPDGHSWTL